MSTAELPRVYETLGARPSADDALFVPRLGDFDAFHHLLWSPKRDKPRSSGCARLVAAPLQRSAHELGLERVDGLRTFRPSYFAAPAVALVDLAAWMAEIDRVIGEHLRPSYLVPECRTLPAPRPNTAPERDVGGPLAEHRHASRDHVQAVPEGFAKATGRATSPRSRARRIVRRTRGQPDAGAEAMRPSAGARVPSHAAASTARGAARAAANVTSQRGVQRTRAAQRLRDPRPGRTPGT